MCEGDSTSLVMNKRQRNRVIHKIATRRKKSRITYTPRPAPITPRPIIGGGIPKQKTRTEPVDTNEQREQVRDHSSIPSDTAVANPKVRPISQGFCPDTPFVHDFLRSPAEQTAKMSEKNLL